MAKLAAFENAQHRALIHDYIRPFPFLSYILKDILRQIKYPHCYHCGNGILHVSHIVSWAAIVENNPIETNNNKIGTDIHDTAVYLST